MQNDKTQEALLPCPFCGDYASLSGTQDTDIVSCNNYKCGAAIVSDIGGAADKWNTRIPQQAPDAAPLKSSDQRDTELLKSMGCSETGSGAAPEVMGEDEAVEIMQLKGMDDILTPDDWPTVRYLRLAYRALIAANCFTQAKQQVGDARHQPRHHRRDGIKITITLNMIRVHSPCKEGWDKLLKSLGKTKADDEPLSLPRIAESNGIDDALWCLQALPEEHHVLCRLLAADFAERVLPIFEKLRPDDKRPREAIEAARKFARGEIDAKARAAAWDAAGAAAWDAAGAAAWDAARAAAGAAAGAARDAARAAAWDAAWDAAGAAAWAAAWDAAGDAARAAEKKEQIKLLAKYFGATTNGKDGEPLIEQPTGASNAQPSQHQYKRETTAMQRKYEADGSYTVQYAPPLIPPTGASK